MTKNNNLLLDNTTGQKSNPDIITGKRTHDQFANDNSQNVVDFCETHGIAYIPIILEIKSQFEDGIEKKVK